MSGISCQNVNRKATENLYIQRATPMYALILGNVQPCSDLLLSKEKKNNEIALRVPCDYNEPMSNQLRGRMCVLTHTAGKQNYPVRTFE
ncbi:hypothetical protein TNIN_41171 [Trichonephila inaurata madagascariensis]|uniref:Uncharacterized protein n=1 Tax=Trichonephila inaurata madagascariensis TaxID=2747483 RepID=A0A8X6YF93_9ARAC|nr:hypothetical protein TNIN_41171 [Trichonephila inaurata madagascariensis]